VNPGVSKETSLIMMRFLSAVFVGFSFFIAKYELAIIVTLMSLSWGAIAGAFMAPFLYGLYWKRATAAGIYAGMIAGLSVSVGLFYFWGAAKSPLAASVGMIVPFLIVPLVSWFTSPPPRETVDKAFVGI
jgi:SSS family solute:Na+ symporter